MDYFQMASCVITAILALGTCVAAIAAAWSAYISFRALRRIELASIPKARVFADFDGSRWMIMVSNVGSVAFTVVHVGFDDTLIERSSFIGDCPPATVAPGGCACFHLREGDYGSCFAVLSDGQYITSDERQLGDRGGDTDAKTDEGEA